MIEPMDYLDSIGHNCFTYDSTFIYTVFQCKTCKHVMIYGGHNKTFYNALYEGNVLKYYAEREVLTCNEVIIKNIIE